MISNEDLLSSVRAQLAEVRERYSANAQERKSRDHTLNELLKEETWLIRAIGASRRTEKCISIS
jgi:uncharacterized protein involved in exopolysaccharide biosynthesis